MHKYARFRKPSRGVGGHNFLFNFNLIFCTGKRAAISAMHVQCMYNSATYFQLRDGTGSEALTHDPTRPDPDTFWPVDPIRSLSVCALCFEIILTVRYSECFLPAVSGLCSTHTDHNNFQHNCKFIQYWKVKTRNSAIADKLRDAFRGQSRSPNMVPFHMLGMVSY